MKVGLTGHQHIGSESDIEWVRKVLKDHIEKYCVANGVCCLASGADQLYAGILRDRKIPLTVVLPSAEYEKTFETPYELYNYEHLLQNAEETIKMSFSSPTEEAFYAAGKEVVNHSDMMFAVWNGKKAKGLGGTADIVDFAKEQKKKVVHINPVNRTIKQL